MAAENTTLKPDAKSAEAAYTYAGTTAWGARRKAQAQASFFNDWFPQLPKGGRVLEIGTGRGEFARECVSRGFRYVGVEPSGSLAAERKQEGLEIHEMIVPPIPEQDNSFDLVHSFDVVEHLLDYRNVLSFFSDSVRVLKPGGYLSVIAPNCSTIGRLFYTYEYQHSFVTTRFRLEAALQDAGLEVVKSRCFLFSIAPSVQWLDRLAANIMIPVGANPLVSGTLSLLFSDKFVRGVHKNLYDHVAVIARRPSK